MVEKSQQSKRLIHFPVLYGCMKWLLKLKGDGREPKQAFTAKNRQKNEPVFNISTKSLFFFSKSLTWRRIILKPNISDEVVEAFISRLELIVGVERQLNLFEHFFTFHGDMMTWTIWKSFISIMIRRSVSAHALCVPPVPLWPSSLLTYWHLSTVVKAESHRPISADIDILLTEAPFPLCYSVHTAMTGSEHNLRGAFVW